MDTSLFDYELPATAIAQTPAERRDESRLMVVNRSTGQVSSHLFRELPDILPERVHCFRNTVTVLKARLLGQRDGGGHTECLLLRPASTHPDSRWWCLLKPGKKLPVGAVVHFDPVSHACVLEKTNDGPALLEFSLATDASVLDLTRRIGAVPLPPYIQRQRDDARASLDSERYQTIYADPSKPFAAAAPTAGLHFTPQVVQRMEANGKQFFDLTLHVGSGTFRPIQTDTIEAHNLHAEFYEIPPSSVAALNNRDGYLKMAIGTTSLRAMEDFFRSVRRAPPADGTAFAKDAKLFIYPPEVFSTDILLTNFHLPRSSLLCLVSAFLSPGSTDGIGWLKQIYKAAIERNFRFYSYGDAMLIL